MILLHLTTHLVLGSTAATSAPLPRLLPLSPPRATAQDDDEPVDPLTAACNAFLSSPLDVRRSVVAAIRERVENLSDPDVRKLLALRDRARKEMALQDGKELVFFDANRYAPGQPVRQFVDLESGAALDFVPMMGNVVDPIDVRRATYDWATNNATDTGRVLSPDDLLWNYLYGYLEDSDLFTAWILRSLDHEPSHDAVALHFQHAYSDLNGRGRPDLSLYEAYAAFQGVDMPDVEVIAFAENILGEQDWVSPIRPGAAQNALFERIHNRFLSYYRYRTLLQYVSDLWVNPESPIDWAHETLRDRILYAFHLDDLDLDKIRVRLKRTKDRGGFISEVDQLANEDPSWRWYGDEVAKRINASRWAVALAAQAVLREQGFLIDAADAEDNAPDVVDNAPDLGHAFEKDPALRVTLWADSPSLYNPTAIDIDAQGRVWVAEGVNYRSFRNAPKDRHWHDEGDRIVVLEDTDGDGQCDRSRVFAQDEDLVSPLGIMCTADGVLVSCSPFIAHYRDTDGDGVSDRKDEWLTGFGGRDHDHAVHSVVFGPDGRWYFNAGNAGPHEVRDADGWMLRSASFYGGGGKARVSDDGRTWVGGLVLRADPDGGGLSVLAHNFRNCYEVALDSFGDMYLADNDDDGNQACRTVWVADGANYGYTSPDGSRNWGTDRRPGQNTQDAHWRQDDPGVFPAGCINGSGGPTGVAVYEGAGLPAKWNGAVLNCDAGRKVVYGHATKLDGAGVSLENRVFLGAKKGEEESNWYRPSDVAVAPDGSVYVADWWDPGVGGHAAGDKEARGRILRVSWPEAPPAVVHTSSAPDRLHSPNLNVRREAFEELRSLGERALDLLAPKLDAQDPLVRARALWLAGLAGPQGRPAVERALQDEDPRVQVAAFRVLRMLTDDVAALAASVIPEAAPAVRREVALSLRDVPYERCATALAALAAGFDGRDRTYLEALGLAADGKEEALYADLLASSGATPREWSEAFAGIAWRLHPRSAIPAFAARALATELGDEARLRSLDALAFVRHEEAAEAMANVYLAASGAVHDRAGYWLSHRADNDWEEFDPLGRAGLSGQMPGEPVWRSGVMTAGTKDVEIELADAVGLWLVVTDGGNGYGCDWADWMEPVLSGPQGELKLTEREWAAAASGWGRVNIGKNCGGGPLKIGGEAHPFGIGTHANSTIQYPLNPGEFDRLRMVVGPDDGGTTQAGGTNTSIEFLVYLETAEDTQDLTPLRDELLSADTAEDRRQEIARELAGDPQGGTLLLHLAAAEQIPATVHELIANRIHRNPDLSVRALASQYFPRTSSGGVELPPIEELAAMAGDADRGHDIFFGETAACSRCHSHGGEGAALAPDLTAVHEKLDTPGVLDAILNPSASILMGYETWMIGTKDGRAFTGFILADGPKVVLKDVEGEKHVVKAEDVEFRKKMKLSAMPDDTALELGAQQLADLAAFLRRRPEPTDR